MNTAEIVRHYEELLAQGQTNAAGKYLEEAAERAEKEGEELQAASCYNELEGFWRVCGHEEKCLTASRKALALLAKNGLAGSIQYATSMLNLATALSVFGHTKEAMDVFRDVEKSFASLPQNDFRAASLLNNMAQAMLRAGDVDGAERNLKKSLAVVETLPDMEAETATCCTNIAFAMLARKDTKGALPYLERAEKIFRALPDDPHGDAVLSCRGQLEYLNCNNVQALAAFSALATVTEKRYGRNMRYAAACRNCATICDVMGEKEGAARWRELAESVKG